MAEEIRAEIVATVRDVLVHEGESVEEGDTLVLLESVEIEVPVVAAVSGPVTRLAVRAGDTVGEGDLIAVVAD